MKTCYNRTKSIGILHRTGMRGYWSGVRGVNTTQPSTTTDRKALSVLVPLALYLTPRTPDAEHYWPV